MERAIGEVIDYNGITLTTIENDSCEGCFFNDGNICTREARLILCSSMFRKDNKNVIFKEMETRTIKLTLEKAKEFYKKGGEFKDLALSAYTEEELTKVELPKTWEEFCNNYKSNLLPNRQAAEAHLALIKLHQLRDCYRQGWKPDWNDDLPKYCIFPVNKEQKFDVDSFYIRHAFLSFQSRKLAEEFLNNFRDFIKQAGDLI